MKETDMSNSLIPFTKDAMEAELRVILFMQASHIAHTGNRKTAFEFLGVECEFDPSNDGSEQDSVVGNLDLTRFDATRYLTIAYDYAFQIGHYRAYDVAEHFDILGFDYGVPKCSNCGVCSPYYLPDSKCRHVVDKAIGRWYLEGKEDASLNIRHLSVLAGMKEGAVRNSLSTEKIKTEGSPASLRSEVALEWLKKRKGFIPSRFDDDREAIWRGDARSLLMSKGFQSAITTILSELKLTPEEATAKAGLPQGYVSNLLTGTYGLDEIDQLQRIGVALGLDVPHFVGKAVEAALRRRVEG
nr:hypothetical protein [uncultured bacterium]